MTTIKFKGNKPYKATGGAAGYDLVANEAFEIKAGHQVIVPTGTWLEIPYGYEGQIRPRSGLAANKMVTVTNAPGTIDSDYRGEIKVILINLNDRPFTIEKGERIAQIVFSPVLSVDFEEVEKLDSTDRGQRGFGSTGVK